MSQHPYSERFVKVFNAVGTFTYTVPTGKRAVVKDFSAANPVGNAGVILMQIAGTTIAGINFSAVAWNTYHWTGMAVVYAGENIILSTTAAVNGSVSGYLFNDP